MKIEEILALPDSQDTINKILDYLKVCPSNERNALNIRMMEIYYHFNNDNFLTILHLLDDQELDEDDKEKFNQFKANYYLNQEKYNEAYQAILKLKNKHSYLGRLYFEMNKFIDAKREYLLAEELKIDLAYVDYYLDNIDEAIKIASQFPSDDLKIFEAIQKYRQGGRLDFHLIDGNNVQMVFMAIVKMKAMNKTNAYQEGIKVLDIVKDVYPGLRYLFYDTFYHSIKDYQEALDIHFELEATKRIINTPLIYQGDQKKLDETLDSLYTAFACFEEMLEDLNKIDLKLKAREIYRLSMIEINKIVSFDQAVILYEYDDHVSIIDYKKSLAYDKDKPLELLFNTPFEKMLLEGKELIIESMDELHKYKDIVTGKHFNELDINMVVGFPIIKEEKTIGGITFYSKKLNLFKDFNYEMIHLFVKFFLAKLDMKEEMNSDCALFASYKYLFDNIDMAIKYIYDEETHFNAYGEKLNEELKLLNFYEHSLTYQEGLKQLINKEIDSFDFDFQINKRYYHENVKRIAMGDIYIYVSIIRDITEDRLALSYQTNLAENSYVCNLPNRRALERDLVDYVDDKFTIFALDINRFKMFNDVYGYDAGDIALKALARKLKELELVCYHLDSDKFILLYNFVNDARAIKKVANKITKALEEAMYNENYRFHFTFTIASLRYPVHTSVNNPRKLIKMVMDALYNAKDGLGLKSVYCDYDKDAYQNDIFEMILMTQVSEAMDNHSLEVRYQQVVDLKTAKVFHYEAKLNISSFNVDSDYITKIAIKRNMQESLDYYLVRNSLKELNKLILQTRKMIRVSIPIDIKTFMRDDFNSFFKNEIVGNAVKTDLVILEIRGQIVDYDTVNYRIQELRNFGIKVIINEINDIIKIQANFIKLYGSVKYLNNEHALITIKNLEALANAMDMHLILADVNTLDEANLLKGFGIKYVLGNCYGKRVTMDMMIERMMKNGRGAK